MQLSLVLGRQEPRLLLRKYPMSTTPASCYLCGQRGVVFESIIAAVVKFIPSNKAGET